MYRVEGQLDILIYKLALQYKGNSRDIMGHLIPLYCYLGRDIYFLYKLIFVNYSNESI